MKNLLMLFVFFHLLSAGPIQFSGSAGVYGEIDTIQGSSQNRPFMIRRFNFNPTLTVYGMPLSMNIFISDESSNLRQEINKYRIFLNPSLLLKESVSLPPLFFSISGFELGNCSPTYTNLTLSGTPLLGGAIEMNPGPIYLAASAGRSKRPVVGSDSSEPAYSRLLFAGRVGFGKKDNSHLFFTALTAKDNENSIPPYFVTFNGDTIEAITPQENYVGGVEANLALFDGKVNWKTELSGSQFTDDKRSPEINFAQIPDWLTRYTHPKMSSAFDIAFSSVFSLNLKVTTLSLNFSRVGTAYKTLGNEFLRNDDQTLGATATQNLLNGILTFDEGISLSRDNLLKMKTWTTKFNQYRGGIGLYIPNLPTLRSDYSLVINASEDTARQDLVSLSSSYNFAVAKINFSPSLFYSFQKDKDNSSNSITLGPSISFSFPLTLSLGLDWISTQGTEHSTLVGYSGSLTYSLFKRWSNSVGMKITGKEDENRRSLFYSTSLALGVFGNFDLRVENNVFNSLSEAYNELRLVGSFTKSW